MPRLTSSVPKYRKHKGSGQAVVTLGGQDVYLGPHGTKTSKIAYDRVVSEWLAAGRPRGVSPAADEITVVEVMLRYRQHVEAYYVKNGQPTSEQAAIRAALRPLRRLYGETPATQFGPLALRTVRQKMIDAGLARSTVNENIHRVRRLFSWAAAEELIPPTVPQALSRVTGLRKGKSDARETEPVNPVEDAVVTQTLPHLPRVAADMVQLQRLTGARPGEICILRPIDVDRSEPVWSYRPQSHKTEHQGRSRIIFLGPQAQAILAPYLDRTADSYCFSPAESERHRNALRRDRRASPMTPSQQARQPQVRPRRPPGARYTKDSYRRAIHRACDLAFPPPAPLAKRDRETIAEWQDRLSAEQRKELAVWRARHRWSPNQLRHAAATRFRQHLGLEAAQVALGHASADVTQVYALRDFALAKRLAEEVG